MVATNSTVYLKNLVDYIQAVHALMPYPQFEMHPAVNLYCHDMFKLGCSAEETATIIKEWAKTCNP